MIGITSWVGWWVLIFFLGSGLTALPVDLINEFRFRPRPMNEQEFNNAKSDLAKKVERLLQIGKNLLEDKVKADKSGGCKPSAFYSNRLWMQTQKRRKQKIKWVWSQLHPCREGIQQTWQHCLVQEQGRTTPLLPEAFLGNPVHLCLNHTRCSHVPLRDSENQRKTCDSLYQFITRVDWNFSCICVCYCAFRTDRLLLNVCCNQRQCENRHALLLL